MFNVGTKILWLVLVLVLLVRCDVPETKQKPVVVSKALTTESVRASQLNEFVQKFSKNDSMSQSLGTVANGKLIHGQLLPFSGSNFCYFDTTSYLKERAFVHSKVKKAVVESYASLEKKLPGRQFVLMECSNRCGGKMRPHRTHQNGLSIDFMMPLKKKGKPCYEYDKKGIAHYLMQFDDKGRYLRDTTVSIDYDVMAQHLLELNECAQRNGLGIRLVIFKLELKTELFATTHGQLLKQKGVYFAQQLSPLINSLHDDHYHVDFYVK